MNKNNDNQNKELELDKELDSIKNICYEYKKNKSFQHQFILTIIQLLCLYCQSYVVKNNIDIGLGNFLTNYIGFGLVVSIILGWIKHFLEFNTTSMKVFKIGMIIIWIIELILVGIFFIKLFF